jgi:hypothetical protein
MAALLPRHAPVARAAHAASHESPRAAASPPPPRAAACAAAACRLSARRSAALGGASASLAPLARVAPPQPSQQRRRGHGRAPLALSPRAAAPRVTLATRRDFIEVSDAFVDAFFLDGKPDALDGSGRTRLARAALNDLEARYSSRRAPPASTLLLLTHVGTARAGGRRVRRLWRALRAALTRCPLASVSVLSRRVSPCAQPRRPARALHRARRGRRGARLRRHRAATLPRQRRAGALALIARSLISHFSFFSFLTSFPSSPAARRCAQQPAA